MVALLSLVFGVTLYMQYRHIHRKNHEKVYVLYRVQSMIIIIIHLLSFIVLMNVLSFSKEVMLLFVGELALLLISHFLIDHFFEKSSLPLWSIAQYLLVISFIIMARLDIDLGLKQFYLAAVAYIIAFAVAWVYHKVNFVQYLGIPAIMIAVALLVLTNSTINGATNWLIIGGFSFQPSELVKVLYAIFIASTFVLFKKYNLYTIAAVGVMTMSLVMIQVFQKDLGSALIYYVLFILMCYVYTTNRYYIIGGGLATLLGGYFAYLQFSHVRVRIEAWLNPWIDIDNKGYQIAQSLFAIANGGLSGTGLTLGSPDKIPVVTTDFIYSAIFEELGMVVAIVMIMSIVFFFLFGIQILEQSRSDFDFLLGSALVIVLAFQSFLIIGGVTKAVPLTGVTLPFVSYGGSSLLTTFVMLGLLQGIRLSLKKHKKRQKKMAAKKYHDELDVQPMASKAKKSEARPGKKGVR